MNNRRVSWSSRSTWPNAVCAVIEAYCQIGHFRVPKSLFQNEAKSNTFLVRRCVQSLQNCATRKGWSSIVRTQVTNVSRSMVLEYRPKRRGQLEPYCDECVLISNKNPYGLFLQHPWFVQYLQKANTPEEIRMFKRTPGQISASFSFPCLNISAY